jgi:hypothetical protein
MKWVNRLFFLFHRLRLLADSLLVKGVAKDGMGKRGREPVGGESMAESRWNRRQRIS